MTQRSYSPEEKAAALSRLLMGEPLAAVAREMDIPRTTLIGWQATLPTGDATVVPLAHATGGDHRAERLRDDLSDLMHAEMTALQKQAEFYASDEWLTKQTPDKILESTRTLRRAVHATMDRLAGRSAEAADSGESGGE